MTSWRESVCFFRAPSLAYLRGLQYVAIMKLLIHIQRFYFNFSPLLFDVNSESDHTESIIKNLDSKRQKRSDRLRSRKDLWRWELFFFWLCVFVCFWVFICLIELPIHGMFRKIYLHFGRLVSRDLFSDVEEQMFQWTKFLHYEKKKTKVAPSLTTALHMFPFFLSIFS